MPEYAENDARRSHLSPARKALLEAWKHGTGAAHTELQHIQRRSEQGPAPLSFAQQRLWFMDQLMPGNPFYNYSVVIYLKGSLDTQALSRSINEIVRRHEALRTCFMMGPAEPLQVILPPSSMPVRFIDMQALPVGTREAEVQHVASSEAKRPFNLARDHMLRTSLMKLGREEHILVLTLHHIASDGWSLSVLYRELRTLYEAYVAGGVASLPELHVQYTDFALWQSQWLQGHIMDEHMAYWRRHLAGLPLLELPTDYPRPAIQYFRGRVHFFRLPESLVQQLSELSKQEGCTLFMMLLTAFQILLSRYSGQKDIVVGIPAAGRPRAELEALIGFFSNTLVIRTDLSGNPTIHEALLRVRQVAMEAYDHQDIPFEKLVDELQPERDMSRTPLVQVWFDFQTALVKPLMLPGMEIHMREVESETAKFDLALVLNDASHGIVGKLRYNTDIFNRGTIERLIGHWQTILEGIVADTRQPLSRLPLLTRSEQRQLLVEWNATGQEYPQKACLQQLFEAQAESTPEAIAIVFEDEQLTYRELSQRANQLAHYLQSLGVGPDTLVGMCLERSIEMATGLLAVLKAGGAYVPLDPRYPTEHLDFMLSDIQAPVLLTQDSLLTQLASCTGVLLCLDRASALWRDQPTCTPICRAAGQNLAYVIYTSGSTGKPKGVALAHNTLTNLLCWHLSTLPGGIRTLQFASLSFDASCHELFAAWGSGGTACMISEELRRDVSHLAQMIIALAVEKAIFPVTILQHLAQQYELQQQWPQHLQEITTTGEQLHLTASIRLWFQQVAHCRLHNHYGPSESHVVTSYSFEGEVQHWPNTPPIGRPITNTQIYVLDPQWQLVPIGVIGELYIAGVSLARGYLGRPELTAERFIPHPFSNTGGERLYRTGDLVRYLADGTIEYLGRRDHQVKLRGYRIELGGIEEVLRGCEGVREAVVLLHADTTGEKRLVGYVMVASQAKPDHSKLRNYLLEKLPDYMVPSAFVLLETFPLNANGKIDRRALPAPDGSALDREMIYVAPRTPVEEALATMWAEVLRLERIGIHDNFFKLGGDSIRAAIFMNKLQEKLGAIIYVIAVFEAPTVALLANYLWKHYSEVILEKLGLHAHMDTPAVHGTDATASTTRIDATAVAAFRQMLARPVSPEIRATAPESKNRPAIFVLAPPRSGTTLLRVMLGGHPDLFSPPELELLSFTTLRERKSAFPAGMKFWLEGTIRAIMEVKHCDPETARHIMAEYEEQGMTVQEFYSLLQNSIAEKTLVDKTPSYTLNLDTLRRAEELFADARYIHLVRNPYGVIHSIQDIKLDLVFSDQDRFSTLEWAELVWLVSQQNILTFLRDVPAERQCMVHFEDLVREPRRIMEEICQSLGLEFYPDMLHPYKGERMTDGLYETSHMLGDIKFHQHKEVDALVAESWKEDYHSDFLGDITWNMARTLGYEPPVTMQAPISMPPLQSGTYAPDSLYPLSFAQQRLWILEQLTPGSPVYNVPLACWLRGQLDIEALDRSLRELVRRHEVWRTRISLKDGQPVQKVASQESLPEHLLVVRDLRATVPAEREALVRRLVAEEAQRPFDFSHDILLRAMLLRLTDEEQVLLLVTHHIAFDGWSTSILYQELSVLYEAFAAGQLSPLPALPVQYTHFALWQRQWLQGALLEEQLAYWKERLAGHPTLDLPTDFPRPVTQTFHGARYNFELPLELTERLKDLSRNEGVTLYMTLLAAFYVLLFRYSGQEDIVVGTPIANRRRRELESLIGFFVNTLVLRADLSGQPGFQQLLRRVREGTLAAYAHQDLPFERLVEELQPERDLSRNPLCQVLFLLNNIPRESLKLPGLTIQPFSAGAETAKFDLALELTESLHGLWGLIECNTDLFEERTIRKMAAHYVQLLRGIVDDPAQKITAVPLLSRTEREQLLVSRNATREDYPRERCLHQLFEEQVALTSDAIALVYEEEQITYAELNIRANLLAHFLREEGVQPDTRVGLCVERSVLMVMGLLSILKSGGAYVPLDPTYPQERLSFMIEDAQVCLLLTNAHLREHIHNRNVRVVCLDSMWETLIDESAENPITDVTSRHLAYVLYTSGSTGRPKGVQIEHRALTNCMCAIRSRPGLAQQDRLLALTTLAFDIATVEVFLPLITGASCILGSRALAMDGSLLSAHIDTRAISFLQATPSTWQMLLEAGWRGRAGLRMICTGEALPAMLARSLQDKGQALWNMYGPTETTIWSGGMLASPLPSKTLIGGPIANTQFYVLDSYLQLVPAGMAGTLYIGGAGLARGYWNRPDLTAERFIPHLFSSESGERLYNTGDRVRYLEDGNLEFLGRQDRQIKLRGQRIELEEIESVLNEHPQVRQAVALLLDRGRADQRLAAYIVPMPATDANLLQQEIRPYLKERLTAYMLPASLMMLDELPLMANGKLDRRALLALDVETTTERRTYVAPRTLSEELLVDIWAQVLKMSNEQIGIHDNFFTLGGHSLLATQVTARVQVALKCKLSLQSFFERPTIAGLAAYIDEHQRMQQSVAILPRSSHSRAEDVPLSFAQQRLWFLDQLAPGNPFYIIHMAVSLLGVLDVAAMQRSFHELLRRHEALRTAFTLFAGEPIQRIAPSPAPGEVSLPVIDLRDLPRETREAEARLLTTAEARHPFNLQHDFLLRSRLLRLSSEEHILTISVHHIASDGWAMQVVWRELSALYGAFRAGQRSPLPKLPIQYADYACWQRQWLQGELLEQQLAYWRAQLADLPELDLQTDFPRPAIETFQGARQYFALPTQLGQACMALSQSEGVTLFMLLLAAFQILLSRYSGQEDIVVGTPIANRTRVELEGLIGFFVNTLVLRTNLGGTPRFREILRRVRDVAIGAYTHQDLPFERLVEELRPERNLSHNPLCQVMFQLQHAPGEMLHLPGLDVRYFGTSDETARFDLALHVRATSTSITGNLEYNTDLFTSETARRMLEHLQRVLEALVADLDQPVSDVPLLTLVERQQLLIEWNKTEMAIPAALQLATLFARSAVRSADAIALSCDEEQLTYAALDWRAEQVARALRELNVAAEMPVALSMERSLDLIVGMLGIFKVGGTYVPLDPDYPGERLAWMLRDSGAQILLTQQRLWSDDSLLYDGRVVCLDSDWSAILCASGSGRSSGIVRDNAAYMIYTSGSTGQPKGVIVTHKAICNHLLWRQQAFGLKSGDRFLHKASIGFDISIWEILWPLVTGTTLVLARPDGQRDSAYLVQLMSREAISVAHFGPAMLRMVLQEGDLAQCRTLKRVFCGGEALPATLQADFFAKLAADLHQQYGPTETCVDVTLWNCRRDEQLPVVPIGYPIANTQIYILDNAGAPVPIGIPGELYVGGMSVARGYLKRPALTAESFLPDPYSIEPGARLYKTGDRARYRADGAVEFLGRRDDQVKVRGYRIEPGEVTVVLQQHPAVQAALVTAQRDHADEKRLVAYVVLQADTQQFAERRRLQQEQISQWQQIHDEVYKQPYPYVDPALNLVGWNSSVTGQPLPIHEMQEWIEDTIDIIRTLRPKRILEIGCGTGLLLLRLVANCDYYCATDFSPTALDFVRRQLSQKRQAYDHVTLMQREANDFTQLEPGAFDLVILNSVIQYFPDVDYLLEVLEGALCLIAPGGHILVGDVRSLPLLEAFHTSIQFARAPSRLSRVQLQRRIQQHVFAEEELVVDPALFVALPQVYPQISAVHVQPRRGHSTNELTRFRYQVVLQTGTRDAERVIVPERRLDWRERGLSLPGLQQMLLEEEPTSLLLLNIPNARLWEPLEILEWLKSVEGPDNAGSWHALLQTSIHEGINPQDLWSLAEKLPYNVAISWARHEGDGGYDAMLWSKAEQSWSHAEITSAFPGREISPRRWSTYTNSPWQGQAARRMLPELRNYLQEHIPDYMVPAVFVPLPALPLTHSGKIDRRALPSPDWGDRPMLDVAFVAPRSAIEEALATIWSEVLGVKQVGTRDNFFDLGGDSIQCIQIVARAGQIGLYLTLAQMFQYQTIEGLSNVIDSHAPSLVEQHPVTGLVPLTPVQRRFFARRLSRPEHWNQAMLLELADHIDGRLLERAVEALLEHHDVLRSHFREGAHGWEQEIGEPGSNAAFSVIDLATIAQSAQDATVAAVEAGLQTSLNLRRGPLLRVTLFQRGPERANLVLLIIHHLIVDGVSWRILLADLQVAYQQVSAGEAIHLPPKTTSFKHWAELLLEYAQSNALKQELAYWITIKRAGLTVLPCDYTARPGDNSVASMRGVTLSLTIEETRALVEDIPATYHTQVNDALLAALLQAFNRWPGVSSLLIDLEGHGREPLFEHVDVSRTVGWFTSVFPVLLELEENYSAVDALKAIKEQLRRVPNHGIGYGLLRYVSADASIPEDWQALPQPEVLFNYLGKFDQMLSASPLFKATHRVVGPTRSPEAERGYLFEINSQIIGNQFHIYWGYSENLHRRSTVESLATAFMEALRVLLARCQEPESVAYTPSDFPDVELDQEQLDRVLAEIDFEAAEDD